MHARTNNAIGHRYDDDSFSIPWKTVREGLANVSRAFGLYREFAVIGFTRLLLNDVRGGQMEFPDTKEDLEALVRALLRSPFSSSTL